MSKNNRSTKVVHMTLCALLVAMYVVLTSFLGIRIGDMVRINFASLTTILAAVLFGPSSAALVAGLGEFIYQLLNFGLSFSTFLWIIPPIVRALMVGYMLRALFKSSLPEKNPLKLGVILIVASLVTSVVNTLVLWADSTLMGYYSFGLVFGASVYRMVSSLITAVLVTLLCIPVLAALRRLPVIQRFL